MYELTLILCIFFGIGSIVGYFLLKLYVNHLKLINEERLGEVQVGRIKNDSLSYALPTFTIQFYNVKQKLRTIHEESEKDLREENINTL